MVRIVVDIDDSLNKEFRKVIIERFGSCKGALRRAVEEAIKIWIQKQ